MTGETQFTAVIDASSTIPVLESQSHLRRQGITWPSGAVLGVSRQTVHFEP